MFSYWHKIDKLHHHNRLILVSNLLLFVITLALIATIITLPQRYEFWLTPKLSANGGVVEANKISDEYIQGFVATLAPTLFSWTHHGSRQYLQKIKQLHFYLSPRHRDLLKQQIQAYSEGQLFERNQSASLYRFFEPGDVKKIAHNVWEVHCVLRLTQRLDDSSAMVLSDKLVSLKLRVIKLNYSRLENPFQLALDGYSEKEVAIKDFLLGVDSQ